LADYYRVLGVSYDDPMEKIRARYRLLAFSTHPDTASNGTEDFARYAQAYRILGNPVRRQHYNEKLGVFVRPRALQPGQDLYQQIIVSQGIAEHGGIIPLTFIRYEPCSLCWLAGCSRCDQQGMIPEEISVNVNVAPGSKRGSVIFIEGQGGRSEPGGSRGDLFVYVLIREPQK
jgi:DnaJ-class molecular chaperone